MWNDKRSITLSKWFVVACMVLVAGIMVSAFWLIGWLKGISAVAAEIKSWMFLASLYTGGVVAIVLLMDLYRLLRNLNGGTVFVDNNVACLRRISWWCFAGGAIALISGIYYLPWVFVGFAAVFVGLIVRVVKNILQQAILIKEENDYTV